MMIRAIDIGRASPPRGDASIAFVKRKKVQNMLRIVYVAVGVLGYAAGMAGLLLFILFAGGWRVGDLSIDNPPDNPVGVALLINVSLILMFGLQHSVMARPWFKAWWTRLIPKPIERSVYCLATAAAIVPLCLLWQPLPGVVWTTNIPALRIGLTTLQVIGWTTVVASSFMVSHTELFGLRQVADCVAGRTAQAPVFSERWLYRFVRHPLQMGLLIGLWVTPHMSTSHMFFAAMLSAYVLVGLHLEERDLESVFGESYLDYQRRVPMLAPLFRVGETKPRPTRQSPSDSAA